MHPQTADLRIRTTRPLLSPALIAEELPLPAAGTESVLQARRAIGDILARRDDRLLTIVGPCSVHDPKAALEYAAKLAAAARRFASDLFVVMRVYFEKPRTVTGWKGLVNDPGLDGSFQINTGLRTARQLLVDIVGAGLPVATEFLDTTLGQYYAETVAWGGIGARTTESQVHRELASGLSMPVGFKNRTDGDVQVAVEAILSARQPHWFPSLTHEGAPAVLGTTGNDQGHLVLRGGSRTGPNFSREHVTAATALLGKAGLPPVVLVDCSHGNSQKQPARQLAVARDLAAQVTAGSRAIIGAMLESNLAAGSQKLETGKPLAYGQSITDACLSFDETVPVLEELARAAATRRTKKT